MTPPTPPTAPTPPSLPALEQATLGGGCFWCLDAVFRRLRGVERVEAGYAGGRAPHPTYEQVCGGRTGHAEVVRVTYDPRVVSYRELLEVFFGTHDPTTPDRQGADVGPQYRSAIFTVGDEQRREAGAVVAELGRAGVFAAPIVTEVAPLERFWPAESHHQDYYARHRLQPYCAFVIGPKVGKLRQRFADKLRAA